MLWRKQCSRGEVGYKHVPCSSDSCCPMFVFHQIARFDLDGLFSNIESVHQISTKLLSSLEEATVDVEPAMQEIGMFAVFFEMYKAAQDNGDAIKCPFPIPSLHLFPSTTTTQQLFVISRSRATIMVAAVDLCYV